MLVLCWAGGDGSQAADFWSVWCRDLTAAVTTSMDRTRVDGEMAHVRVMWIESISLYIVQDAKMDYIQVISNDDTPFSYHTIG